MNLRCPHCQNAIEVVDLPDGGDITCAGCGSSFRLDNYTTASWTGPETRRIGKFDVLGTLGQGAFGTVLKAHDRELDRTVAIKIPRAANVGSRMDEVDRFLREARAVAQLRFPSIISVHEVGVHDGAPYLVSDFVEGLTLADVLTGRRLTFQESAKLLAAVADALQYAHSLGVIHRDVKPSNIMIRPDGSPCIMDFGLAKRDAAEITMTLDGQILGTPAYMSPEQARGDANKVDGRSDVYSSGVILYQLLTGELPFRGNKAMLLHQVLHDDPKPPRTLNDKIPRDLETIALKAMAKEPGRRYAGAKELAEDLRCWLAGEPILARPVAAVERLWRWCKRKPALATANAAVLVALVTFVAAFVVVRESLTQEQIERGKAEILAKEKEKLLNEADDRREQAEELALQVAFNNFYAKAKENAALALVGTAQLMPKAANLKNKRLLESMRLHLGGWAQEVSQHQLRWIHSGNAFALSSNGRIVLMGNGKTARLWDTAKGKPTEVTLEHQGGVYAAALSADGKIALTSSIQRMACTIQFWNTVVGEPIGPPHQLSGSVHVLALSADGKIGLFGSGKTVQLWETATAMPIGAPLQDSNQILYVALSANAKTVLISSSKEGRLWDATTGKAIGEPLRDPGGIHAVALSADGKIALTGLGHSAQLWDGASGKPIGPPLPHQGLVTRVALSADGKIAFTMSFDRTARLWDTVTGNPIGPPLQHEGPVTGTFSADGKVAVTQSFGRTHLWDTTIGGTPIETELPHPAGITALALSADGKTFLTGWNKLARLWDRTTGKEIGAPLIHQEGVYAVGLSRDGKMALTGSSDKTARLWETATAKLIGAPLPHPEGVRAVGLSGDGKIALAASAKTVQLWETTSGKRITLPLANPDQVNVVALSTDGYTALAGYFRKDGPGQLWSGAMVWETTSGKPVGAPISPKVGVSAAALSADGKIALTGSPDGTIRLWDTATGTAIGMPLVHQGSEGRAVALSADGKVALTARADKAWLWETATGKAIGPSFTDREPATGVALSADAQTVLTWNSRAVQIWHVPLRITRDPEHIILWAQVITRTEVDDHGNVRVLSADEWQRRRQRLEQLGGPPVAPGRNVRFVASPSKT